MSALTHDVRDQAIVEAQLQRPLKSEWRVARRCHLGVPMAIENHPYMQDGTPFPTLYWLTCPILAKRASQLEGQGWMADLNGRLSEDESLRARLKTALIRLLARREEHAHLIDSGAPPGGGPDKVKCLHAHLAHELSDPPNPVGSLTLSTVGWPDCRVPCVDTPGPRTVTL
jgi:uncharacterized protein